jgi:hypothetical protein
MLLESACLLTEDSQLNREVIGNGRPLEDKKSAYGGFEDSTFETGHIYILVSKIMIYVSSTNVSLHVHASQCRLSSNVDGPRVQLRKNV